MQILGDDNLAQDAVEEVFVQLPDALRKKGAVAGKYPRK